MSSKIHNYTSINHVLEGVRREFGFEIDLNMDDVREWIWSAIGLIGSQELLFQKQADIEIENHRAPLPIDVFDLTDHRVRDKDSKQMMTKSQAIFFKDSRRARHKPVITSSESVKMVDGENKPGTEYVSIIFPQHVEKPGDYMIQDGYIFTSEEKMTIQLSYTAFPLDEQGFPLVPDDPLIYKFLVWFIGERLAFKYMLKEKISERKYDRIEQEYSFVAAQLQGRLNTLDIPDMRNFKERVYALVKPTADFERGI